MVPRIVFVEENCCPARYETRVSCKPEQYQQDEEDQDCNLCKFHGPQFLVLVLDNLIGLFLLGLCRGISHTTKILLKTRRKNGQEISKKFARCLKSWESGLCNSDTLCYVYICMCVNINYIYNVVTSAATDVDDNCVVFCAAKIKKKAQKLSCP